MQEDGSQATATALKSADVDAAASLTDAERTLLDFVVLLTRTPHKNSAAEVQKLRDAGWSDEQIAECVYITALFAFFNRVAEGFGLDKPDVRDFEPQTDGASGAEPAVTDD